MAGDPAGDATSNLCDSDNAAVASDQIPDSALTESLTGMNEAEVLDCDDTRHVFGNGVAENNAGIILMSVSHQVDISATC
jgi:hypothetical protein